MAAEEGQVVSVHTVDAWNEQLQKGNDTKKLVYLLIHSEFIKLRKFCLIFKVDLTCYLWFWAIGLWFLMNLNNGFRLVCAYLIWFAWLYLDL
jgi:hypothetical protein